MTTNGPIADTFHPADIAFVADNLRDSDRAEIQASYAAEPLEALTRSVQASTLKWTIRDGDLVIGIFGVGAVSMMSDHGSPWLLATPDIENIRMTFLRQSRICIGRMLDQHSFLENWVDVRNTTSVKWLKWCGFKFDEPQPFGVEGRDFHRFYMKRG